MRSASDNTAGTWPTPAHVSGAGSVCGMIPFAYDVFAVMCVDPDSEVHQAYSVCLARRYGGPREPLWAPVGSVSAGLSESDAAREMIKRAGF